MRNIQKFLKLQGIKVSHVAVYKWIRKYVGLMEKYLDRITPKVSDTWRADELYLKIKGDKKYLFALMDDEARFWIAQEVAYSKYKHDARSIFKKGKELMIGFQKTLENYEKEHGENKIPKPKEKPKKTESEWKGIT